MRPYSILKAERGVVCELAMYTYLDAIADVVREELLSPEQWTIVRCATLIPKRGTDEHTL